MMLALVVLFCVTNSYGQSKATEKTVSSDLLTVYQSTKTATTESEITSIAKQCAKVIPDKRRSETDREYAENLLAWALNRRGEMRTASAAKLVEQSKLQEADGLDDLALQDYQTAVEYAPANWRIQHNLAIALAMKGRYKNAVDRFNEVIKLKDDYPNAYFNRGELYFELKQYTEAIGDYDRAIELSKTDPQYFNSRGHCRYLLESYDEAIEDYRKAVELGSDSAVYQTDLADALQATGQWEEAAEMYRQAVATNPKYARAYMNAAWLMATCPEKRFRNTELALSASKKAIELEVNPSARAYDTLAAAHAAAGKATEAVAHQKRAIQLSAEEDRSELKQRLALYQRGTAYVQPGESQTAPEHSIELKSSVRTASDAASTKKSR
jgi:tetratricopeptide (TPR) repeat protein